MPSLTIPEMTAIVSGDATERALLLSPFPTKMRYRNKAWEGNIVLDGEWISDGHIMVSQRMIRDPKLSTILLTPNDTQKVTQGVARSLITETSSESCYPVEILGVLPGVRLEGNIPLAYLLYYTEGGMFLHYVSADLLTFVVRGVLWDSMTTGHTTPSPVMFRSHGAPVGMLMPLNLYHKDAQRRWDIDIPTAIEHMRETTGNHLVGPGVYSMTRKEA